MKAGILLRIGIYVIGLYSLQLGLGWAAYFGYAALADTTYGEAIIESSHASIWGSAVVPLVFALACFGFASAITRVLLGAEAETVVILEAASASTLVRVGIKLLGLYTLCSTGGYFLGTFYELIAVRSGNTAFKEEQVVSDLITNGVSLALAGWLLFRTEDVARRFFTHATMR